MTYQTALIVDDSKLARITLRKKLEQRGLSVEMAESGVHALEFLASNTVDIVFMDHLMPELDGFSTTKKIKENPSTTHIPVIMCTGKEYDGYLDEARAIGAANILSKPPENEALDLILAAAPEAALASKPQVTEAAAAATPSTTPASTATPSTTTPPAMQSAGLSQSDVEALVKRLVNDSLNPVNESISSVTESLNSVKDSLNSSNASLKETLSAEITATQQQSLDHLSQSLTTRLDTLDGALQNLEAKTDQVQQEVAASASEQNTDELQGAVKTLVASEVAQIAPAQLASLVDLNPSNDAFDADQLKATQETVERLTSQMVDMDGRIDELSSKLTALGESISQAPVVEPIAEPISQPLDVSAEHDAIREELAELKQQLETLQASKVDTVETEQSQSISQADIEKMLEELRAELQSELKAGLESELQSKLAESSLDTVAVESSQEGVAALAAVEELRQSMEQRLASQDAILANSDNIPTLEPEYGEADDSQPQLGDASDLSFDTRTDLQHQLLGDNNELKESLGKMKMVAGGGLALAVISLLAQFF